MDGDEAKGVFETCIDCKTYNKTFFVEICQFEIVSFLRLFLRIVSCFALVLHDLLNGECMSKYRSDGDEKLMVREVNASSFRPILRFFRRTLCAGPVSK